MLPPLIHRDPGDETDHPLRNIEQPSRHTVDVCFVRDTTFVTFACGHRCAYPRGRAKPWCSVCHGGAVAA